MKRNKILKLSGIVLCLIMLCGVLVMTASAKTVTDISIVNLEVPFPDAEMDFDVDTGSDDYVLLYNGQCVFWIDEETCTEYDHDDAPVSFVAGHDYRIKVYIDTAGSNTFPAASDMTATINGLKANVYEDGNGYYYVQRYYDDCRINNIEINIPAPQIGEKPSFEKINNTKYVSTGNNSPIRNGIKWYDVTAEKHLVSGTTAAIFEGHHKYKVEFVLKTANGFEFGPYTTATVNGKAATIELGGPMYASVIYTFDELGCVPALVNAKEATCTVKGYTGDMTCTICKNVIEKGKEIDLKAHTVVKDPAVAATYKAEGKTEGSHCSVCKTVFTPQTATEKLTLGKAEGLKVKAVKLAKGTKTTLTLSWNAVDGAEKYEVQQYVRKKWVAVATTEKTSLTVKKLKANKTYKFRVRAIIENGQQGAFSKTLSAKTVPLKTTLSLKAGKSRLTASWKTVANITGYEVQYSTAKNFKKNTKTVKISKAKTKKTTIKKLKKGSKYYARVRAYKVVDGKKIYGAWSAVKNVKVK